MGMVKHSQSSSHNSNLAMSLQYLQKKVRDQIDFLHADIHQIFQQVNFNTLGIKVSYKVILSLLTGTMKHCQSTQSNKFAISLQRLKKKTLGMEFIFCMQINTKVSKSWDYCFWWKSPDMSKVPTIFAIYTEKTVAAAFVFYCYTKHSDIFRGSSHVHCYLFPCTATLYRFSAWTLQYNN